MLAHRLPGGGSSSLSISCLSVVSTLIAAAHAHLWSSFRRRSESPLLTYPETVVSSLLSRSRLSPGLPPPPPASCGALAPFRLCSCSQPQSSPWDPTSEAPASAPSPRPPRRVSRQASRAGECWSAPILCAGISALCPLHPRCCALLRGSEASPHHPPSPPTKGLLVCGNLSSFTAPSQRYRSRPFSFVSVFCFFYCPTRVRGEFLAFWEVCVQYVFCRSCSTCRCIFYVFVGRKVISMSYSSAILKVPLLISFCKL